MRSKKNVLLGLVILGLITAAPTFAIPIAFDFTGTVQSHIITTNATGESVSDTSLIGVTFSAQMVIETNRFLSPITGDHNGWRDLYTTTDENSPASWFGSLSIGGNAINVQPYGRNYASVTLNDTEGPQSCGPGCAFGVPDSLTIVARSDLQGPLGTTNSSLFQLNAFESLDFSRPDPASYTYIDLDRPFSIDSLLTIALPDLRFSYSTSWFDCQAPGLCFAGGSDRTVFNVDSVTRTDLSAGPVGVPEPGTLGLLGFGLLVTRFTRRKQTAS